MRFIQKYLKQDSQSRPIYEREELIDTSSDNTQKHITLTHQRCSNCNNHLEHDDVQIRCAFCERAMCKSCLVQCAGCQKALCYTHRRSFAPSQLPLCQDCARTVREREILLHEVELLQLQMQAGPQLPGLWGVLQQWRRSQRIEELKRRLRGL